jgi:hypothetical protein
MAMALRRLSWAMSRDIGAVDADVALLDVIEALEQGDDGRFAGAGRADEADALAGFDGQREVVEHRRAGRVAEADVLEGDAAGAVRQGRGAGGVGQVRAA